MLLRVGIALFDLPHRRARTLLSGGMPVYLSVNPVEYHGPHLSLHNDRLLSEGLIRGLGDRLQVRHDWPLVLADHLAVGVDPCPGPGSRPVSFSQVRRLVVDSCRSLRALGAQRVVLMTFHGAPLHNLALEAGAAWLRARGVAAIAPFHLVLAHMLDLRDVGQYADALAPIRDPDTRRRVAARLPQDFHAGFFETSLALHWAEASVADSYGRLPPCPEPIPDPTISRLASAAEAMQQHTVARELRFAAQALGWQRLRPFPGYTSWPAPANRESGAAFAGHILRLYSEVVDDVLHGRAVPPRPIMPWTRWMTMGGRWPPSRSMDASDVLEPPES